MGGQVKKGKIQAYIADEILDQFKAEAEKTGLTESKLIEKILVERYGLAESVNESAINPGIEDRLKYLENRLSEVDEITLIINGEQNELNSLSARLSGKVQALIDCYSSLEKLVMNRLREVEASTESLNNLCKSSFEIAFNRIGRLERGERVNDLALNESATTIPNAQEKINKAKLLAADIKLNQQELADRLNISVRSLQRWKMRPEDEFHQWLGKHEPKFNLIWKLIPNTNLFQPALKPLPLKNSAGEPVDPSLEYRYNAAIKAIEELALR